MSVLNFSKNYLYIAIPRTGSESMASILGLSGHEGVMKYKSFINYLTTGVRFDKLYKFAFVRHPHTRFESAFNNLMFKDKPEDINEFVKSRAWYNPRDKYTELLFRPQWRFLCNWGYTNQMDFIGKYENLEEDWAKVCKEIGISHKLPHLNKSEGKQKLNKESKDIIYEKYKVDLHKWYDN